MISLIAAMTEKRVIGVRNQLPWKLPEDMKRFRELTTGHPIIMGRKTYDSIGRPLPKRENLVISRQPGLKIEGAQVFSSLESALERALKLDEKEVFVIGGAEIYRQALARADRLYLTLVHQDYEGDAHFPEWESLGPWRTLERVEAPSHTFLTLQK
jgi:dihydrofolate reductase